MRWKRTQRRRNMIKGRIWLRRKVKIRTKRKDKGVKK